MNNAVQAPFKVKKEIKGTSLFCQARGDKYIFVGLMGQVVVYNKVLKFDIMILIFQF